MMVLCLLFVALSVYFGFMALYQATPLGEGISKERFNRFFPASELTQTRHFSLEKKERLSDVPFLNRLLSHAEGSKFFSNWLQQSGFKISTGTFLLLTGVLTTGPPVLLRALNAGDSAGALLLGIGTGTIPFLVVHGKRMKRQASFEKAFPDAIARLAGSLRAGYSLQIAIENLVKDTENIVGEEFHYLLGEMEVGQSFETALSKMVDRIDTSDLRLFIASVTIQRESGGNLAVVLNNLEHTIRERFQLRRELQAASGQAKLSGLVLSLLPIFVSLLVYMIHPDYILFFVEDPTGKMLLWMAVGSQLMGMLTIRKIITIEM